MCSTQSGDREVDFFFIVWSCDEKESFIKLRESRRDISAIRGRTLCQGQGPKATANLLLRLDLVGPEKLPGSYGVDCD